MTPPRLKHAAQHALLHATQTQGSTELWEWNSQLASEAFKLHDRVLRQYMTQVCTACACGTHRRYGVVRGRQYNQWSVRSGYGVAA